MAARIAYGSAGKTKENARFPYGEETGRCFILGCAGQEVSWRRGSSSWASARVINACAGRGPSQRRRAARGHESESVRQLA